MTIVQAIVLAIIEGLTEFLPVSSTGHMIIGSTIMGIAQDDFVKLFTVAIQLGAILSVVVLYCKRFFQGLDLYYKLIVAVLPAVLAGIMLKDVIDALLENVLVVGIMLFIGGIVFLYVDKWFANERTERNGRISFRQAFTIGIFQCLAIIPGVSRSAATIIGGLSQGLTRTHAAEFSFFLAVPTMFGATLKTFYDYWKDGGEITAQHMQVFAIGNVVAFIVAIIAIRTFISFLSKHGFRAFGWYRIAVGGAIIVLYLLQVPMQMM